jgi:hypothetical protein
LRMAAQCLAAPPGVDRQQVLPITLKLRD